MSTLLPKAINLDEMESTTDMDTPTQKLLKPADYNLCVSKAEIGPSKNGQCTLLKLTLDVIDPRYDRKRIWDNIIVEHEKPSAVAMGRRRIKELCDAIGVRGNLRDASILVGQSCVGTIGIEPEQNGYPAKNVVVAYSPHDERDAMGREMGGTKFEDDDIPF